MGAVVFRDGGIGKRVGDNTLHLGVGFFEFGEGAPGLDEAGDGGAAFGVGEDFEELCAGR